MPFDINEARQIIAEARERGLIRSSEDQQSVKKAAPIADKIIPAEEAAGEGLPEWLRKGIRESPGQ